MVNFLISKRFSFIFCLLVMVSVVFVLPGGVVQAETREVCAVGCTYTTIQSAIDAAEDGDVISIKNGTYAEAVVVNKQLSLIGESRDGVMIDASGHTGYAVSVTASNVLLRFFTVQNGNHYGIKISGANNITLQFLTITHMARSGVDLNGVSTAVLDGIRSTGAAAGVGIAVSDSQHITMNDIVTTGNAWGGIGIYTLGEHYPGGVDGVTLTGLNAIQENPPIYVELENFTNPADPYPALNLNLGTFVYRVSNSAQPNLSVYYTSFVQARATVILAGATEFAAIQNLTSGQYLISPGLKIHAAVRLAEENGHIYAYNGEYLEPQIVVDKNITITGESQAGTILHPLNDTASEGDDRGWLVVNPGVRLDLNTLTLDGAGKNIHQAVRSFGSGAIDQVTFKNITDPGYQGTALANLGQNMTITNNTFFNIGRTGIVSDGPGVTDSLIASNTYTGKGSGDWLDYAVEVGGGAVVRIEDNTITNNSGQALDGTTSAGVLITSQTGIASTVQLSGNAMHGCTDAIRVGMDTSDLSVVTAHYNNISGNANGVFTHAPVVDARLNWWGAPSGPAGVGPGSGDGISENVTYSPWLGFLPGTTPMTWHTDDDVQAAIAIAQAGDTVMVNDGTYEENLIINQNLSIIGQGENTILLAPESIPSCFSISDYDAHPVVCVRNAKVTLDQLTVDGAARGNGNYKFMGAAFRNAGGSVTNMVVRGIKSTPIIMEEDDNGLALFLYNNDGISRSFAVDQTRIEGFQKNAMAISAVDDTALAVSITNNQITGQGHTPLVVQNGIQVWGDLLSGTIENNTVDGIGFISTDPAKKLVATSILNYYADVDVLGNTVTGAQTGLYVYDGSGRYVDNQFEVFKVGYSGFGMVLTDPPGAMPSPSAVADGDKSALETNMAAKSGSENIIFAENNQVIFNGTDNAGTIGIDAEDGHGTKNVSVNINANTVQGFDFGITLLQCSTNCQPGVFTHLQALCNRISGNNKGMYSNVADLEMIALYNWWGDASGPYHSSQNPGGLGDRVIGPISFTPWLAEPVCPVNFAPAARGDAYLDAVQNEPYQVSAPGVLANDINLNGDPIRAVLVDDVRFGTLTLQADGAFTYTPKVNFTGQDWFTYYATDGSLNSETVTVQITVVPGIPITGGGEIYLPIVVR